MKSLILVSHGNFCKGIINSVKMILGSQSNLYSINLLEGESPDHFKQRFLEIAKTLDDFIVFTDLLGGTPYNVVYQLLLEGNYHFELYTGMNLPMVISFINSQIIHNDIDIVSEAKKGIKHVNNNISSTIPDEEF
ncbi:PTS sugar transporter subunit IIA [Bombilactobacillus bombi]|uniref:PTS sugar transporter subunit IIA n=1 Tax=Bombilactobacillus bombi TaxID=1303590 RepID=UPI0015E62B60|nr:PTS fructose transporter subunit IIA [Bombilactobacillus bombi]MBA1434960.1 PTS fructose transporter subunit IIA [Bombilactobacillus bombi]